MADGGLVRIGNSKGDLRMRADISESALAGTVIAEGVWPDDAYDGGVGINLLIDATPVAPAGGSAFHDTAIWLRAEPATEVLDAAD